MGCSGSRFAGSPELRDSGGSRDSVRSFAGLRTRTPNTEHGTPFGSQFAVRRVIRNARRYKKTGLRGHFPQFEGLPEHRIPNESLRFFRVPGRVNSERVTEWGSAVCSSQTLPNTEYQSRGGVGPVRQGEHPNTGVPVGFRSGFRTPNTEHRNTRVVYAVRQFAGSPSEHRNNTDYGSPKHLPS